MTQTNQKETTKLKEKSTRVKRKRLEKAGPLYIDPQHLEPGKHYRVVNDSPGEIQRRIRMGYKITENRDLEVGDKSLNPTRLGSAVVLDVGRTLEKKGVLMEIPVEDYQEIVDELNELADEQEDRMYAELDEDKKGTYYGGIRKDKV